MDTRVKSLPDSVQMPWSDACRLNAWALVAVAVAFLSRLLLKNGLDLGVGLRAVVALLPLLPGLLYVRSLWYWASRLDEFQRRLQFDAICFAALGMLLVALAADLLRGAGLVGELNLGWEGYFAGTFSLWVWGLARAGRRYQ